MTDFPHYLENRLKRLREEVKSFPHHYRLDAAQLIVDAWVHGRQMPSTDAPDLLRMFREAEYGS